MTLTIALALILHGVLGFTTAAILIWKVLEHPEYSLFRRFVMSFLAGTLFLSTPSYFLPTPFIPWSFTLARLGIFLLVVEFVGTEFRQYLQRKQLWPQSSH